MISHLLFINYPSWIHPEIFPSDIPVLGLIRWYGLMYIFAFGTAFLVLKQLLKEGALDSLDSRGQLVKATEDDIYSFIGTGIVFLLLGARLLSCLLYDREINYWLKPWLIFWPFDETMSFTGLAGMSYHGGFIGGFAGMIFWCWRHKKPMFKWIDAMGTAIPLGYTFGRLGNFLNGELFGRVTTMPWGMVFPKAAKFPTNLEWVKQTAEAIGMNTTAVSINLPRHPSQLYEAFFEGLVLFAILWVARKRKPFDGFQTALYTAGYGFFRFFIEYFRQPDAALGFILGNNGTGSIYLNSTLSQLSMGQLLCIGMMTAGLLIGVYCWHRSRKNNNQN